MPSTINLHIHTTHSDGGDTVADIVAMLKNAGVTTFSITDHDTAEGNAEAAILAKEQGLTHINGIELSCCFSDGEIGLDESWTMHILGYGFDLDLMKAKLAELENRKHKMLRELFDLLVADGYNIEFTKTAQDGKIAERTYIAKELIRQGYAADGNEAFAKILNTDRYRPYAKYKPSIIEGIRIIHSCGGLVVWAHPFGVTRGGKKELSQEQVYKLLFVLIHYCIDGIEVYYQQYTPKQIEWLRSHADTYCLYKTVGTDYHNAPVDLTNTNLENHRRQHIAKNGLKPPIFRSVADVIFRDSYKYPEYAEAKKRERLAFDVVEPDLKVGLIIRRMVGQSEDSYCDKCPHFGIADSEFHVGFHIWAGCRLVKAGPPNNVLAYSIVTIPSYVERPDWCPLAI